MQRPRRTTELIEIPNTASKRQTRSKLPSLAGPSPCNGTAKKFPRQSRMTSRASSQDGVNNSAFLQVPTYGMAKVTPQKAATPLAKANTASRTLFTSEKRSVAVSTGSSQSANGPLHNDKKWVQEQCQAIMDFLETNTKPGQIVGIPAEFFTRSGGLKTMSIKQFVAIINFFLQRISGSRLTVGANHVEDTVNILQKLNYPYQINKSCLKTPNTQHSFGNVIMILSFLMDLAAPEMPEDGHLFEFQDLADTTVSSFSENVFKPDKEILAKLMKDSIEGWYLWNEQLNDEYAACEEKTCDFFIQQLCGLKNFKELDEDILNLKEKLSSLRETKPILPSELEQLHKEMQHLQAELQMKHDQVDTENNVIRKFDMKKSNWLDKLQAIKVDVDKMRNYLKVQKYTVEGFDKLVFEVDQMKYQQKIHQKTIVELGDLNHKQQVVLSRKKKHLTDEVDSFNAVMRQIHYFDDNLHDGVDLQLSLNPGQEHLNYIIPTLKALSGKLYNHIVQQQNERGKINLEIDAIRCRINSNLLPTLERKQEHLQKEQIAFQEFITLMQKELNLHSDKIKKLQITLNEYQKQRVLFETIIKDRKEELEKQKKADEDLLKEIEEKFKENATERIETLEKCEKSIDIIDEEMEALSQLLDQLETNDMNIAKFIENS